MNDIEITNAALLKLGATPIRNFSGTSPESKIATGLYGIVKNMLLSSHTWYFAGKRLILEPSPPSQDAEASDAHGLTEYDLPEDFLRAVAVFTGDGRNIAHYEIRGRKLRAEATQSFSPGLSLDYIADISEENLPHYFISALISRLAADFCVPLTDSTARMESLYRIAEAELQNARNIDNRQQPPHKLVADNLLGVRG